MVDFQKITNEGIAYIRDQRAGQATFLPSDTITTKPVNEKHRSYVQCHGE